MAHIEDRYLGDGVYASFDGDCIVLDLRAQDDFTRIVLGEGVLSGLVRYETYIREKHSLAAQYPDGTPEQDKPHG